MGNGRPKLHGSLSTSAVQTEAPAAAITKPALLISRTSTASLLHGTSSPSWIQKATEYAVDMGKANMRYSRMGFCRSPAERSSHQNHTHLGAALLPPIPLPSPPPSLMPARNIVIVALVRNARRIRTWTNIARKGRRTVKSVEQRGRKDGVVRMVKSVSQWEIRNGKLENQNGVNQKWELRKSEIKGVIHSHRGDWVQSVYCLICGKLANQKWEVRKSERGKSEMGIEKIRNQGGNPQSQRGLSPECVLFDLR